MRARLAALACVVACGGSHTPFPNNSPDAPVDGLPPSGDAPPGAVTLTVTDHGLPVAGLNTYFQAADASLVFAATTDDHGTAGAVLADGGFVTVIEFSSLGQTRIQTFAGIKAGDALHLDLEPADAPGDGTIDIAVPTVANAIGYDIRTTCGRQTVDTTGAGTIGLGGCNGTADMIVFPLDDNGDAISALFAAGVDVTAQPVTVTGTYKPLASNSFDYSNIPTSVTGVRTYRAIATARGRLVDASTFTPRTGGSASANLTLPDTTATTSITVSDGQPSTGVISEQLIIDWADSTASYSLDLAGAMLPAVDTAPTFDVATHSLRWTEQGGGGTPQIVRGRVLASRGNTGWTWSVAAAHAQSVLAFPAWTGGGFDFTISEGDNITVEELALASAPGGYDAIRPHAFADFVSAVAGPTGRIAVELYTAPAPL
jgi:hypothetical protein